MSKIDWNGVEVEALFDAVGITYDKLLEAVADLSETPGFRHDMLTLYAPALRTWNFQMDVAIREIEKLRQRLIREGGEIGTSVSGDDVELDGRF